MKVSHSPLRSIEEDVSVAAKMLLGRLEVDKMKISNLRFALCGKTF